MLEVCVKVKEGHQMRKHTRKHTLMLKAGVQVLARLRTQNTPLKGVS